VPRYHFDLVDSKTVSDEGGTEPSGDIEAMAVGEEIAHRLIREHQLKGRHYFILVTNEDGDEMGRCPLDSVH